MALRDELREEARTIAARMMDDAEGTVIQIAKRWRHARISVAATALRFKEGAKTDEEWREHLHAMREKQLAEWRLALALSILEDGRILTPRGPVGDEGRGAPRGGG